MHAGQAPVAVRADGADEARPRTPDGGGSARDVRERAEEAGATEPRAPTHM